MKLTAGLASLSALICAAGVSAVPQWGQCGGINYTGVSVRYFGAAQKLMLAR